jgi:hypothetical protein
LLLQFALLNPFLAFLKVNTAPVDGLVGSCKPSRAQEQNLPNGGNVFIPACSTAEPENLQTNDLESTAKEVGKIQL